MRVLLLDTSFAAGPVYNYLIEAGHDVWVMGNRPRDLLVSKAGVNWVEQDYGRVEPVAQHVARLGIETVVPGCTDVSIETCLQLRAGSEFRDSPSTNERLCNKQLFRFLCGKLGLPAPLLVHENTFPVGGQFICKPVDGFSGRGITIFDGTDLHAFHTALEYAREISPSSQALIETFMPGELHSCSGFVQHEKLTDIFFVKEGSSVNPFAVDTSYVVDDLPLECVHSVRNSLNQLCSWLKLKDGLLHTQFILSGRRPFIVEVARRCPGDLYPLLIEYSTGFPYAAKYASYFLGKRFDEGPKERRHILRHTVTADKDAPFEGLMLERSEKLCSFFPIAAMGEELRARQGNRAGILFTEHTSDAELKDAYHRFLNRRAYRVDAPLSHTRI